MGWYRAWRPYVSVATRRTRAAAYAKKLAKSQKRSLQPIELVGHKITKTFWGNAWCDNLERYSDFANRLPRGRTYVRNGSVIDLQIQRGKVAAIVSGSEIYHVTIAINSLAKPAWKRIKRDCAQSIASLIDLLQGRFDQGIMQRLTDSKAGLFPQPHEIKMHCTCPDWATLCKHVAATLYGAGARLDAAPELLFTLRDVDHLELVREAVDASNLAGALTASTDATLGDQDLGELFGIELENATPPKSGRRRKAAASAPAPTVSKPDAQLQSNSRQVKRPAKRTAGSNASGRSKSKALPALAKRETAKTPTANGVASTTEAAKNGVRKTMAVKRPVAKSATAASGMGKSAAAARRSSGLARASAQPPR